MFPNLSKVNILRKKYVIVKRRLSIASTIFILLFLLFLTGCISKNKSIGLQPYNNFNRSILDTIKVALEHSYPYKVNILPDRPLPKNAFVNIKSPRYRADSLLIDLNKHKPDSLNITLGITSSDISTTKKDIWGNIKSPVNKYTDWGIFGLGYRPGTACVVSTFRLNNSNNTLFINRLKKVAVHEIGHNLGLKHCKTVGCVMQDAAETIKTIDSVSLNLCPLCKKKAGL